MFGWLRKAKHDLSKTGYDNTYEKQYKLVTTLLPYIPDVVYRFGVGVTPQDLEAAADPLDLNIPDDLTQLYYTLNGEFSPIGSVLGFSLSTLDQMLSDYELFLLLDEGLVSIIDDDKIISGGENNRWLPIATDSMGGYIIYDLSPAVGGKPGQIIALDLDGQVAFILAESLDALWDKIGGFLASGQLQPTADGSLTWVGGRLLKDLNSLYFNYDDNTEIEVPPHLFDYYTTYNDGRVMRWELMSTVRLSLEEDSVDLALLKHMPNLRKLDLIADTIAGWENLASAPRLQVLSISSAGFSQPDLETAADNASQLTTLMLTDCTVESGVCLEKLEQLNYLSLDNTTRLDQSTLIGLKGLRSLYVADVPIISSDWLRELVGLTHLYFYSSALYTLDFIYALVNLKYLFVYPAVHGDGWFRYLPSLRYLEELTYPFKEFPFIEDCPSITTIGVDVNSTDNLYQLEYSSVANVTIFDVVDDKHGEGLSRQLGYVCRWLDFFWRVDEQYKDRDTTAPKLLERLKPMDSKDKVE